MKNSSHSINRARERSNLSKRKTNSLMKEASKYGLSYDHLPEGPLREYIRKRSYFKRVKLYKGHVFVFAKTSTACITMYPVDPQVLMEQEEFDKQ